MAFITNVFVRTGLTRSVQFTHGNALHTGCRRWFSEKVVGPAPADILKATDVGHQYYMRNLEKFRTDGRITYLTPEQLAHTPQEDVEVFKGFFETLLRKNEDLFGEVRILNARVEQLLRTSGK